MLPARSVDREAAIPRLVSLCDVQLAVSVLSSDLSITGVLQLAIEAEPDSKARDSYRAMLDSLPRS